MCLFTVLYFALNTDFVMQNLQELVGELLELFAHLQVGRTRRQVPVLLSQFIKFRCWLMGSCWRFKPELLFDAELCEDVFESPKWRPQCFTHREISVCAVRQILQCILGDWQKYLPLK